MKKQYLGDGCYVEFDGFAVVLTTENGVSTTNRIVLEPEVWEELAAWAATTALTRSTTPKVTA